MKKIKICLILSLLIIISSYINVFAYDIFGGINSVTLVESEEMYGGVLYEHNIINSSYSSNSKLDRDVYTYTIPSNSNDVKLATWTYSSQNGYQNKNLMDIASDYEKCHPGYVVLGGINTEGYVASLDSNSVNELTNAFIQDGDVIRKDISAEETKEMIALLPGGAHVIKRVPSTSANPYLYIYDNDGISEHLEIKYINTLPTKGEISVLTPSLSTNLDLSSYNVYECYYDLYRVTTNFPGGCISGSNYGIFLKGHVVNQINLNNINSVQLTKFYIVSDKELNITENIKIKVQYDYLDEFGSVESAVGYWFKYLENGVVCDANYKVYLDIEGRYAANYGSHDYWKSVYKERAGIGFKENGDIIILAANTNTGGPTQYEVGEYFKMFGCTDAYQFDGGGSVTFIKRNDLGKFEMLNTPADGVPRTILSGLFIVAKVSDINLECKLNADDSINIKAIINDSTTFDKLYLTYIDNGVESERIEFTTNNINVNNLVRGKTYQYNLYLENEGIITKSLKSGSFFVPYKESKVDYVKADIEGSNINIKVYIDDIDERVDSAYISIGIKNYTKLEKVDDYYCISIKDEANIYDPLNYSIRYKYNDGFNDNDIFETDAKFIVDYNVYNYGIIARVNAFFEELLK